MVGTGTAASCTEAALDAALAGGGMVTFDCGPGTHTIGLTSEKIISDDTQIDGGGAITLNANNGHRHFRVQSGVDLELSGVTLRRGREQSGGSIYNNGGTVVVKNSSLIENKADGTSGNNGGAIYNSGGIVEMYGSTFIENTADSVGGAVYNDGGFVTIAASTFFSNLSFGGGGGAVRTTGGSVTIKGSTFDRNQARAGGGVFIGGGTVTIENSTFSKNLAGGIGGNRGGAVRVATAAISVAITSTTFHGNLAAIAGADIATNSAVTIERSVFSNSTGTNCTTVDAGTITSLNFNLSDDGTCNLDQGSDLPNTPADLAPLGNYGGQTQTHHPEVGSAVIDSASFPCATSQDQRGVSRAQPAGVACDRGSVEVLQADYILCQCLYPASRSELRRPVQSHRAVDQNGYTADALQQPL